MKKFLLLSLAVFGLFPGFAWPQTNPSPMTGGSTGIEGVISVAPSRGGPTRQDEADSIPAANMTFEVKQNGRVIKSFQPDNRGRFHLELEPGHYTISRKDRKAAVGFYGPFEVEVARGRMTKVEWKCDTGMR
jgi:hypothetical protein